MEPADFASGATFGLSLVSEFPARAAVHANIALARHQTNLRGILFVSPLTTTQIFQLGWTPGGKSASAWQAAVCVARRTARQTERPAGSKKNMKTIKTKPEKEKTTVPGIPAWSPTAVLTWRYHA